MTARSHETIRVGLRRIIRDPNASAKVRMHAIERLMYVEGLLEENGQPACGKVKQPVDKPMSKGLRDLLDTRAFPPRHHRLIPRERLSHGRVSRLKFPIP